MKTCGTRRGSLALLAVLVCLQLIHTAWTFAGKQVFHSDENWSYGLANSYYQPHIFLKDGVYLGDYASNPASAESINVGEWVSGETFRRYVTVQEGERFAYASVYHNQTLDSHPPLYYFLLHTACSFFPDRFSWWYGFFLSGFFLVGTQVFLYLLAEKVMGSPWKALLCCLLYGVGNGALLTFTFIRQYSLLTMLCVAYAHACARLHEAIKAGVPWRGRLLWTMVLAFCAFFTHYYAIMYIGAFTAIFCLWLLWVGRWKRCLQFGFSMAGTLGVFLLLYPAFLMQAFSDSAQKTLPVSFWIQYKMILNYVLRYNLGISVDPWKTPLFQIIFPLLLFGSFCLCLLYIPFRREPWMGRLLCVLRGMPARLLSRLRLVRGMQGNPIPCCVLVAVLTHCGVVNLTCNLMKMGGAAIRYVFLAFPPCCFMAVCFADWVLGKVCRGRAKKAALPLLACLTLSLACCAKLRTTPFLIERQPGDYRELSELLRDRNCLFVLQSSDHRWLMVSACKDFRHADQVFVTFADCLEEDRDRLFDGPRVDYVLVDDTAWQLDEEGQALVDTWNQGRQTDIEEAKGSQNFEMIEVEDESEEPIWANETVCSLNGGCEYDILFGVWMNGHLFYVLELK